jgi:hypothetical protein
MGATASIAASPGQGTTTGKTPIIGITRTEDPNERGYDTIRRLFLNEMAKGSEGLK